MSYTRQYSETVYKDVTIEYDIPITKLDKDGRYRFAVLDKNGQYQYCDAMINIPGYGRISVQPNESGSKTVTVDIPVDVNIHVDTAPFDQSVANCNGSINTLTGTVVATETVQIASIDNNAKKVAGTIVKGFFNLIRSEISQQTVELSKTIEAHLLHLRELTKICRDKQKQMEADYHRLSVRYKKIFGDLNNELESRVKELNKPAFSFKNNSDSYANRLTANDMVSTVAIFGREGCELQGKISVSIAKRRALETIFQAHFFLMKQKKTDETIRHSMINENISAMKYFPVCLVESQQSKNCYQPDCIPKTKSNVVTWMFKYLRWSPVREESKKNIQQYFNSEINQVYSSNNPNDLRVKEMILKMFDINSINSV